MSRETAHAYRTALVTGASSGIGASIARLLAAAGTDLVMVARRAERLAEKAAQLRGEHKIAVETLQADLTKPDELAAVEARLADPARPVELLVNNAGAGAAGEFERLSVDSAESLIRLNVLALVRLTHAGLPGMLARRHGGILNVSSMAGFAPSPRVSTYAATKAFVTLFSESLHVEVRDRGVHVTALCPGFTRSEFHTGRTDVSGLPRFAWLNSDEVARAGLAAVAAGRALSVPGAQYKVAAQLTKIAPRVAVRAATARLRRL